MYSRIKRRHIERRAQEHAEEEEEEEESSDGTEESEGKDIDIYFY